MKAKAAKPKQQKDKLIGPEFLTYEDFEETMRRNPRWIEGRFEEEGITVPAVLKEDLDMLKRLEDRMHCSSADEYEVYESTLYSETLPVWVRLQNMGFSPEIVHVNKSGNHTHYYVPQKIKDN
jgi:hypothetical protein